MKTKQSAVAVVFFEHNKSILLLKRSGNCVHSNEVCLPGGVVESVDKESLLQTAIRETFEETHILLCPKQCMLALPKEETSYGASISPYLFRYKKDAEINVKLNKHEASEYFFLPRAYLTHEFFGVNASAKKHKLYLQYQGFFIWGVTATILSKLIRVHDEFSEHF
ncbi:MAG: NUDIX hydrolase [Francisellaceae bacterium]